MRLPNQGSPRLLVSLLRGEQSLTRCIEVHEEAIGDLKVYIASLDLLRDNAEAQLRAMERSKG